MNFLTLEVTSAGFCIFILYKSLLIKIEIRVSFNDIQGEENFYGLHVNRTTKNDEKTFR